MMSSSSARSPAISLRSRMAAAMSSRPEKCAVRVVDAISGGPVIGIHPWARVATRRRVILALPPSQIGIERRGGPGPEGDKGIQRLVAAPFGQPPVPRRGVLSERQAVPAGALHCLCYVDDVAGGEQVALDADGFRMLDEVVHRSPCLQGLPGTRGSLLERLGECVGRDAVERHAHLV